MINIHTEHKDFQHIRNEKFSNLERMLYILATINLYTGNKILRKVAKVIF